MQISVNVPPISTATLSFVTNSSRRSGPFAAAARGAASPLSSPSAAPGLNPASGAPSLPAGLKPPEAGIVPLVNGSPLRAASRRQVCAPRRGRRRRDLRPDQKPHRRSRRSAASRLAESCLPGKLCTHQHGHPPGSRAPGRHDPTQAPCRSARGEGGHSPDAPGPSHAPLQAGLHQRGHFSKRASPSAASERSALVPAPRPGASRRQDRRGSNSRRRSRPSEEIGAREVGAEEISHRQSARWRRSAPGKAHIREFPCSGEVRARAPTSPSAFEPARCAPRAPHAIASASGFRPVAAPAAGFAMAHTPLPRAAAPRRRTGSLRRWWLSNSDRRRCDQWWRGKGEPYG